MWRDIERLCARCKAPFQRPAVFPKHSLLALRLAFAAAREPWVGDFVRDVFYLSFALDVDIAGADAMAAALTPYVADAAGFIERAMRDEAKAAFKAQTE